MLNYNKNKLINECLDKYYETFSHTLDTADFVPDKFNDKILNYIFKNLKKSFKVLDKEDRIFQRKVVKEHKKKLRLENKQAKQSKKGGK